MPLLQRHPLVVPSQRKLGRLYAPDPRDLDYPMVDAIRAMKKSEQRRRTQAPQHGPTLDQGQTPECVEYSDATSLGALPVGYHGNPLAAVRVKVTGDAVDGVSEWTRLYDWSQDHDEFPGRNYEGTSVRAGQEYLRKIGRSANYVWARNLAEAKDYVSRIGAAPPIIGIDIPESFFEPKKINGRFYVDDDGAIAGGHAMCVLWYSQPLKAWKMQMTWGEGYGDKGIFYIPDDVFEYRVFMANGEMVSYTENKL